MRLYQQQRELQRVSWILNAHSCLSLSVNIIFCLLDVWLQPVGRDRNPEKAQGGARIQELCHGLSFLPYCNESFQRQSHQNCAKSVSAE
jgi:hypothetical protein